MEAVPGFRRWARILVFKNVPAFPVLTLGIIPALCIDHHRPTSSGECGLMLVCHLFMLSFHFLLVFIPESHVLHYFLSYKIYQVQLNLFSHFSLIKDSHVYRLLFRTSFIS